MTWVPSETGFQQLCDPSEARDGWKASFLFPGTRVPQSTTEVQHIPAPRIYAFFHYGKKTQEGYFKLIIRRAEE